MVVVTLVDGPNHGGHEEDDVYDDTGVERTAEGVDEEQFKPAAHGDDAGHHAVEHEGDDGKRQQEYKQRPLHVGIGILAVVEHQHDGGDAEQVEQVHADRQTCHVGDEHQPAVAVGLVGFVFPFQDEPEHHGSEGGGVGIDLTLYGTEPEGVAEGVDQGTHESGCLNGDEFRGGQFTPVAQDEFAGEVGNRPEQEQDTHRAEQRAHDVHHVGHLGGIAGQL